MARTPLLERPPVAPTPARPEPPTGPRYDWLYGAIIGIVAIAAMLIFAFATRVSEVPLTPEEPVPEPPVVQPAPQPAPEPAPEPQPAPAIQSTGRIADVGTTLWREIVVPGDGVGWVNAAFLTETSP